MALQESLAQVDDALFDYIVPGMESVLMNQTTLLDKIKKSSKGVHGRSIKFKTRLGGNARSNWALERDTLPGPGARKFDESTATLRYFYMPVEITGQELAMPKAGGVIDLAVDALEDTVEAGLHQLDSDVIGDGTGRMALCNADSTVASSITTVTLDTGKAEMFQVGQNVRFGTNGTDYEVLQIDAANLAILLDGDATAVAVDNAAIYNGAAYSSSYNKVISGIKLHAGMAGHSPHANYQSFDRTAVANYWTVPYVNSNSGADRVLTTMLMRLHLQTVKGKGGKIPNYIATSDPVLNSFILLLESNAQKIETLPSSDGHKEEYQFVHAGKKMTINVSDKIEKGAMYFLDTESIELREMAKMQWDTKGSGGKWEKKSTTDVVWGRVFWYLQMICLNNLKQSVVKDIKENSITL